MLFLAPALLRPASPSCSPCVRAATGRLNWPIGCRFNTRGTSCKFGSTSPPALISGISYCVTCSPRLRSYSNLIFIERSADLPRGGGGDRSRPCSQPSETTCNAARFFAQGDIPLQYEIAHLHETRLPPTALGVLTSSSADQSRVSRLLTAAPCAIPQRRPAVSSSLLQTRVALSRRISNRGPAVPSFLPLLLSTVVMLDKLVYTAGSV